MTCTVVNCSLIVAAKGLCAKHYARMRRYGTTDSKYDKKLYVDLGGIKDPRPGARGSLAVNIINDIKFKAKKRRKEWALTHEQAYALITSDCKYCGASACWPSSRNGIDRVDNSAGYFLDNCVSCCFTCNSAKKDLTLLEFEIWIERVYRQLLKNKRE